MEMGGGWWSTASGIAASVPFLGELPSGAQSGFEEPVVGKKGPKLGAVRIPHVDLKGKSLSASQLQCKYHVDCSGDGGNIFIYSAKNQLKT